MFRLSFKTYTTALPQSLTRDTSTADLDPRVHLHDLRHTGNHFAAASGASTRELMHRMGHASMRAALIYQHATAERDARIAATLNQVLGGGAGR